MKQEPTSLMYSCSKKNGFLAPTRLILCFNEFNQLKNYLNLYKNEQLFN